MKHFSLSSIRLGLCAGSMLLLFAASATAQTILFSDNFDTDSSGNWSVFNGSSSGTPDYNVWFAFDYSTNRFTRNGVTATIPPAPNGGGKGVKMDVNKNDEIGEIAAVSIYPKDKAFSGAFSLKFDMWLNYNGPAFGGSGSTEFATFGINHAGDKVNWQDGVSPSDGVWFGVTGEAGAASDYRAYVGDGFSPAQRSGGASDGFIDHDGDGGYEDDVPLSGDLPPTYPPYLMFPSPDYETQGMPSKRWVEVEIRQRTNEFGAHVVTWLINNYVIAETLRGEDSGMVSGNIMLGNMDIFSSIASPKEDNFVIYDNVRVIDLTGVAPLPVVTVVTNDGFAAEPADTATFTIARSGDSSQPLIVNYRMTGTASNAVDYAQLPGQLTLASGQTSTNLVLTPIDDPFGETLETATLVLLGSTNYDLYTNFSATVSLEDDGDVPAVTVITVKTNAYEGNAENAGRFNINLSTPNSAPTIINFTLSGTAVSGTDYTAVGSSISIPAGETNGVVRVAPINNGVPNSPGTVTLNLTSGTGYRLGSVTNGTVTIRDDDFVATGTLLYSEDFEADHTANWAINASPGDNPANLFFDYSNAGIPSAPNSTGGSTRGAMLQANLSGSVLGGVSISPSGLNLSGDYVLRFDLWQNFNGPVPAGGSGSTQLSGGGVGTAGNTPQVHGGTHDSVWFASTGDGGANVDYRAYSSTAGSDGHGDTSGVWAAEPFGAPRNNSSAYYYEFGLNEPPAAQAAIYPDQTGATFPGAQGFAWHDVVIQKQGNTVTWFIDGKLIATVNAEPANFSGGNILLVHSDINSSSSLDPNAPATAFGLFDNVRVYQLAAVATAPDIQGIQMVDNGANVQIEFTGDSSDSASSFTVQSAAAASGPYTDVSATVSQVSPALFRAVLPVNGPQQFYRIRR